MDQDQKPVDSDAEDDVEIQSSEQPKIVDKAKTASQDKVESAPVTAKNKQDQQE